MATVHITLSLLSGGQTINNQTHVKYWEIMADNLIKAGLELGLRLNS